MRRPLAREDAGCNFWRRQLRTEFVTLLVVLLLEGLSLPQLKSAQFVRQWLDELRAR